MVRHNNNSHYCKISNIKHALVDNKIVDHSDVGSWSIVCRHCPNYIFILNWTPGFNGLGTDNCETTQETFNFWDCVSLILEVWRLILILCLFKCHVVCNYVLWSAVIMRPVCYAANLDLSLDLHVSYNELGIDQTWTHLPLDTMAAILQMTFSNAFSWMKSFVFWVKFHWSLFLMVQLTITQHWFR